MWLLFNWHRCRKTGLKGQAPNSFIIESTEIWATVQINNNTHLYQSNIIKASETLHDLNILITETRTQQLTISHQTHTHTHRTNRGYWSPLASKLFVQLRPQHQSDGWRQSLVFMTCSFKRSYIQLVTWLTAQSFYCSHVQPNGFRTFTKY